MKRISAGGKTLQVLGNTQDTPDRFSAVESRGHGNHLVEFLFSVIFSYLNHF